MIRICSAPLHRRVSARALARAALAGLAALGLASASGCRAASDGPAFVTRVPTGAGVVFENATGVVVPADFGCIHHTGMELCYPCQSGDNAYFGPDPGFDARINTVRLYGMGGLEWSSTEKSPGRYDWRYWDSAFAKLRRAGVKTAIYNPYNPPQFYTRYKHDYGGWRMQLPRSRDAFFAWLDAITRRYPEIRIVEVANEVLAPTLKDGFWIGTEAELMQLADWVLDWRRERGWTGRVWAPSVPGFLGNVKPYVQFLQAYARTAEFDAIPAHFYYLTAEQIGEPSRASNHWTSLRELRAALAAAGIKQPLVDGEKGFAQGALRPSDVFNYGLRAALEGIEQVCFFHWGSLGRDETNLGQPFRNPAMKAAFERLAALAGKRIVKVEQTAPGTDWVVTTAPNP